MSADSLCDAVFCIGRVGPGNAASNQIFERNLDFRASLRNVCLLFYLTTEILMQALIPAINSHYIYLPYSFVFNVETHLLYICIGTYLFLNCGINNLSLHFLLF